MTNPKKLNKVEKECCEKCLGKFPNVYGNPTGGDARCFNLRCECHSQPKGGEDDGLTTGALITNEDAARVIKQINKCIKCGGVLERGTTYFRNEDGSTQHAKGDLCQPQPKGEKKTKHKIGECGAVMIETQEGSKCAECGEITRIDSPANHPADEKREEGWEERFEEKFVKNWQLDFEGGYIKILNFISQLLEEAREEAIKSEKERVIGILEKEKIAFCDHDEREQGCSCKAKNFALSEAIKAVKEEGK